MKRLLLVVACVLLLAGPVGATNYDFMALTNWVGYGTQWSTSGAPGNRPLIGVSSSPGGPLFGLDSNYNGRLVPLLSDGNVYYLYMGNLNPDGTSPLASVSIDIYTDYVVQGGASPRIYGGFNFQGTSPGTFQLLPVDPVWYYGSYGGIPLPALYLGWAQGTADLVSWGAFAPDNVNDIYLVLGIGVEPTATTPIPLPGAIWLLGSGLLGLVGWRRFRN